MMLVGRSAGDAGDGASSENTNTITRGFKIVEFEFEFEFEFELPRTFCH